MRRIFQKCHTFELSDVGPNYLSWRESINKKNTIIAEKLVVGLTIIRGVKCERS